MALGRNAAKTARNTNSRLGRTATRRAFIGHTFRFAETYDQHYRLSSLALLNSFLVRKLPREGLAEARLNVVDVAQHFCVCGVAVAAPDGIENPNMKIDHVPFDIAVDIDAREGLQRQIGQ